MRRAIYRVVCIMLLCYVPQLFSASNGGTGGYTYSSQNYYSSPKPFKKMVAEETGPWRNQIGVSQEEDYVNDLESYWSFSSLYYYRRTDRGIVGARVNYANKYNIGGEQYQIEAYPVLTPNIYTALTVAISNTSQQVYPKYQYLIEPYFNLPYGFEVSVGQRFVRSFDTNIYTYTGSIGKNIGQYFIWFRPYHYTPKSSDYFEAGIKRYFECLDNTYVSFKMGMGRAPDIGDVPPLNQITNISTKMIGIDGQFHVTKSMLVHLGAGYTKQVFLSGHVREITNGSVNLIWQF